MNLLYNVRLVFYHQLTAAEFLEDEEKSRSRYETGEPGLNHS